MVLSSISCVFTYIFCSNISIQFIFIGVLDFLLTFESSYQNYDLKFYLYGLSFHFLNNSFEEHIFFLISKNVKSNSKVLPLGLNGHEFG